MDVYNDYLNMFNWINTTTIIIGTALSVAFMVGVSIIKQRRLVNTIKKAVKDAIKELNIEQTDKLKQAEVKTEELNINEDTIQK